MKQLLKVMLYSSLTMDSATQNPVKLRKTSLAVSEHKPDILLADTRIVEHLNLYDEFHFESIRPPPPPPVSELCTGLMCVLNCTIMQYITEPK